MKEQNEMRTSISEPETMINQLKTSLIIKLILFSVGFIPKGLQYVIYICSNLQLLSVFANTALLGMPLSQDDWFRKALSTIHEIFSIADLFDFKEHRELTHLILVINLILVFTSVTALIYFQITLNMNYTHPRFTQRLWQLLLWLYTPCFFYPVHYTGLKLYDAFTSSADWVQENPIPHRLYIVFIIMSLCLNFLFAYVTSTIFKIRIKTKSVLSSSIPSSDVIDLLLKTIIPIFWERMGYSQGLYITLLVLNLVSAIAKDIIFFRFLPFYRVFTLQMAVKVHAILTFFAFALLLPKFFSRKNISDSLDFSALICLTGMPLFVYLYSKLLGKLLIFVVTYPNKIKNVYYLIHYWEIYKHYAYVCKAPKPRVHGIDKNFLHHNIARIRLQDFQEGPSEKYNVMNDEDENASLIYDRIVNTIQQLVQASDKSNKWLLKALLARFYLKYESLFILADDLLNQSLKNAVFLPRKTSIYFLKLELLNKLKKKEVEEKLVGDSQTAATTGDIRRNKLSIQTYLALVNMCDSQRKNMISQLKFQIQFWDKFQANKVDCQALVTLADQVQSYNRKINKRWANNYPSFTSVHYTKPILTYSFYLSFAQNDFDSGDKLIKEYYLQELKHKRKSDDSDSYFMTTELLSAETLFIVISGSPNSLGKVLDCSNNFERTFAFKKDFMIGRSINNLIPAFFAERHDGFMQSPHELIQARINRSKEVFVLDRNGFLATCVTYLTIRFLPEHGLCYYMLLKPPAENKESLLVHANGQILNFSQKFGQDMKLKNSNKDVSNSIFTICPDFEEIIQALTMSRVLVTPEKSEILENNSPAEFPSPPTLVKNQSSYSYYSPSPNLFSPNVKKQFTFQTSKLQTNKDAYYQNIFQKYSAGAELNFYPLSKISSIQGDKMTPFKGQAMSYQAVIQVFTYDKETVFTVILMKLDEVMNTIAFLPQTMDDTALLNQSPKRRGRRRTTKKAVNFEFHDKSKSILMNKKSLFDRFANLAVTTDPYDRVTTLSAHLISEEPESLPSRNDLHLNSERHETNAGTGTTTENAFPIISSDRQEVLCTNRKTLIEPQGIQPTFHGGDLYDPELEISVDEPLNVLTPTSSHGHKNVLDFKNNPIKEENIDGNYIDKQIAQIDYELEIHSMSKKSVCHLVKQGIKAKRYRPSTFVFGFSFLGAMMLQLAFLIWMSFGAIQVSSKSQDTTAVIETLHLRIVWMNLANLETRFWNALRAGWVPSYWGWEDLVDTQLICYGTLDRYNKELISGVSNLPPEYQAKFYEKNTRAMGRDSAQNLTTMSYDNTFQLTDKIIASGYQIIQFPPDTLPYNLFDFIDPISRFIYDNSYDDLLINSENLITLMKDKLASDLADSKSQIVILLSLILTLLTLFAAGAFAFVFTLNKEVKHFFIKLQTAQPNEIKKTLFLLTSFNKMLQREDQNEKLSSEPIQNYFSMRDKQLSEHSNEYNPKNNRKTISKPSLYKIYSRNYLYLFALYTVLTIVAFFVCFYYAKATSNIEVISKQQNAVNVALDNMKKHSFISAQLEAMIMENASTTFQNVPILESIFKDLDNLNSGVELYNTFVRDQTVSPEIYSILYNRSCQHSYAPEYLLPDFVAISACMTVSSQTGYLGLIQIAAYLTNDLTNFVNEFLNSDRSRATLKKMNIDLTRKRIGSVDASMAFSFFLLNAVLDDSTELNEKFQDERTLLAYIAIIISLLSAALSWVFIVKKLIRKELMRNDILALLPVKLICENQLLKRYVFNR